MNELSCSAKLKTTHGRQAPPFVEGDECPYLKTRENAAILLPFFLLPEKHSDLWMALFKWISFHCLILGFSVILSKLEQKLSLPKHLEESRFIVSVKIYLLVH